MTIKKGQPWGSEACDLGEVQIANDDSTLAALAFESLAVRGDSPPELGVESGDLLETVGGHRLDGSTAMTFPIDLGLVSLDGGDEMPFVGHVVVKHRLWSGPAAAVMNAAWLGSWYLGPRAHPNDGLLDITIGSLSWSDRTQARKRVLSGTHLPHPDLTMLRRAEWSHRFDRATPVFVDGVNYGRANRVAVRVIPDAFHLIN